VPAVAHEPLSQSALLWQIVVLGPRAQVPLVAPIAAPTLTPQVPEGPHWVLLWQIAPLAHLPTVEPKVPVPHRPLPH